MPAISGEAVGFHNLDVRVVEGVEQVSKSHVANRETQLSHVLSADGEEVEDVQGFAHSFTVEDEVALILGGTSGDHFRNRGDEPQTIDACDGVAFFSDEKPASIHFLLHPVIGIGEEVFSLLLVDGVEELALNTAVFLGAFDRGLLVVSQCQGGSPWTFSL
jgi:hypothetical protein